MFDIDNTLLSFDECVKESMKSGFEKFKIGTYEDGMFSVFNQINTGLWQLIEKGELDFEELRKKRWNMIFERLGITADGEVFEKYYKYKTIQNAESSFANLCAYAFIFNGEYAEIDNNLVTRIHFIKDKEICYHQPLGEGNKEEIIKKLIEDSKEKNQKITIICNRKEKCEIYEERDFFDYLYLREDLQHLKGRKYQPKRNHINKFTSKYQWEFTQLNSKNCFDCLPLLDKWQEK